MSKQVNRRVLLVDDNPAIHADYRKILGAANKASTKDLDSLAGAFFGDADAAEGEEESFELESALQGEEALAKLIDARRAGRPFAMAFVDVRMPPGWDGVETLARLWEEDPDLQAVICTAFSDYSYEQMLGKLGRSQNLLILKKPFDTVEVQQLASALTQKWSVTLSERLHLEEIRAYASSLETVNRALSSDKAMAEAFAASRGSLVLGASQTLLEGSAQREQAARDDRELAGYLRRTRQLAHLLALEFASPCAAGTAVKMDDLLNGAKLRAEAAGIEFHTQRAANLPAQVSGEIAGLGELLGDLVDAAQASGSNQLRLDLALVSGMHQNNHLRVDAHLGGPTANFERVDQGTEPFLSDVAGLDFSLVLARKRASQLAADLTLEQPNGTSLHVTLTLDPGLAESPAQRSAAA